MALRTTAEAALVARSKEYYQAQGRTHDRYEVVKAWFRNVWYVYDVLAFDRRPVWKASFRSELAAKHWASNCEPGAFGRWADQSMVRGFASGGSYIDYRAEVVASLTEGKNKIRGPADPGYRSGGDAEAKLWDHWKKYHSPKTGFPQPDPKTTIIHWDQGMAYCGSCAQRVSINLSGFPFCCGLPKCPVRLLATDRKEVIAHERARLATVQLRWDEWMPERDSGRQPLNRS